MSEWLSQAVHKIANFPAELVYYQRWLEQSKPRSGDSYLFAEEVPRFEPVAQDLLVLAPDISLEATRDGVVLESRSAGARVEVPQVGPGACEHVLGLINGQRTCAELLWSTGVEREMLTRLLRAAFGVLIFAPVAIDTLERELSGLEVARFPGSPYEVERRYWQNMCGVAQLLQEEAPELELALETPQSFVAWLQRLHIALLMGRELDNFYRPASPIVEKGVCPGHLLVNGVKIEETFMGTLIVRGASVNAALIGGELYHRALYESLGEPEALAPRRQLFDHDGLNWGQMLVARGAEEPHFNPIFCPPRPLTAAHFAALTAAFAAAHAAGRALERQSLLRRLANFHQCFIQLHPFECGNQSLAMSLVNHLLRLHLGAGIPHLLLDHFAFRLSRRAYEDLFERAVGAYLIVDPNRLSRYQRLRDLKRASYTFIARLSGFRHSDEVLRLAALEPEAAKAALFADNSGNSLTQGTNTG